MRHFLPGVPFCGPKFSGSWFVGVCSDVPVALVFFVSITTGSTYNGTHSLWNGTTVCQGPCRPLSYHSVERGVVFGSDCDRRAVRPMSTEPQRICPSCGSEVSGAMEFCPVCMLRKALAGGVESGASSASEDTVKPAPERAVQRFEHYELVTGEDGKPVELGSWCDGRHLQGVRCRSALSRDSESHHLKISR
jgi:hypothetical protein